MLPGNNLLSGAMLTNSYNVISRVSCQKGPTHHAYAWQIGPFWQDTLDMWHHLPMSDRNITEVPFHLYQISMLDSIIEEIAHTNTHYLIHWQIHINGQTSSRMSCLINGKEWYQDRFLRNLKNLRNLKKRFCMKIIRLLHCTIPCTQFVTIS